MASKFNPNDYLIDLRGKKYLPVNARLAWFRDQTPDGSIDNDIVMVGSLVLARSRVIVEGIVIATGHATVRSGQGTTWAGREVEKAETAAMGRALAVAGFGTMNAGDDFEEGSNLADSPVPAKAAPIVPHSKARPSAPPPDNFTPTADEPNADLTDRDAATAFVKHWHAKGLDNNTILAALQVERISEWTEGRAKADTAISAYINTLAQAS